MCLLWVADPRAGHEVSQLMLCGQSTNFLTKMAAVRVKQSGFLGAMLFHETIARMCFYFVLVKV